jgi:hypothetical protein
MKDLKGQTVLFLVALNENEAAVRLLLEKGADIEAKDSDWGVHAVRLVWFGPGGRQWAAHCTVGS